MHKVPFIKRDRRTDRRTDRRIRSTLYTLVCMGDNKCTAFNGEIGCLTKKSISRAVPHKRCSTQNSSWIGNVEKILSSLENLAVSGTVDNFLIFAISVYKCKIVISKLIKCACSCILICYLPDITVSWFNQTFRFLQKMFLFSSSWLELKHPSCLWKMNTFFVQL